MNEYSLPSPIPNGKTLSTETIIMLGKRFGTEMFYKLIREKRNSDLKQSDWSVGEDSPLSEAAKQPWVVYRQALRDVPQSIQNIEDVVWPEPPTN
jgi:hypothetical protein